MKTPCKKSKSRSRKELTNEVICLGKYLYNLNREKNNNLPRYILTKKEKEFLSKQNLK